MINTIEKSIGICEIKEKQSLKELNIDNVSSAIEALLAMKIKDTKFVNNQALEKARLQEIAKKTKKYYTKILCANLNRL